MHAMGVFLPLFFFSIHRLLTSEAAFNDERSHT
jgi:hypothetical protein